MEYCQGDSLQRFIETENPIPENKRNKFIRHILDALKYLHANGIIHRDLKPANVFIDDKDNAKLGDFGLAVVRNIKNAGGSNDFDRPLPDNIGLKKTFSTISLIGENSTSKTVGVGTRFYRSPEQQNSSKYDEQVYFL